MIFTLISQTAQQEKEGLVILVILTVILIVGAIWGAIDRGSVNDELTSKSKYKHSKVTPEDIYRARNYLENDLLVNKLHKRYLEQEEEKKDRDLKNKAEVFNLKEYRDADIGLRNYIDTIEKQTSSCNKCYSSYMRIWFLSDRLLELRCESCKKKFKYNQEELNEINLNSLITKLNNNNKRHNESVDNKFIRDSVIELDFNGHKSNSPEWYYYTMSPKGEPVIGRVRIKKENYRSRRISQEVVDAVWNRDGGKCIQCSSNENLEFDHIIPFSKGGANTYRNIQLLCESCNRSKSARIG